MKKRHPIRVEQLEGKEESNTGPVVSLLQGLANIQVALRELMEDAELVAVANDESLDHILTGTRFLTHIPKSMRVVIACPKRPSQKSYASATKENNIALAWFRGDAPPFLATRSQAVFLYYMAKEARAKPFSPLTVSSNVSQIAVVNSERYARQVIEVFELFWRNSEHLIQAKRRQEA